MSQATSKLVEGSLKQEFVDTGRRDEIGQLGSALNDMARRLEGHLQGQKRFLSDIAHELCSPLARLRMGLAILENKIGPEVCGDFLEVAEEADNIARLVDEILDFSRAELRSENLQLEDLLLLEMVEGVCRREKISSERFQLRFDPKLKLRADSELFSRALANLLRNALRYGSGGRAAVVEVEIVGRSCGEKVMVEIIDHGTGVPEAELENIFAPFYRLQADRNRRSGGNGLGLAIVKSSIEACGGRVWARNLQPSGFCVGIELPKA
ncbi:MAG: HAMP domain-containing histidine kinase, partial [Deltaproteobacteria bacterium]|nr:HAMP domain-containing histidine kinase [Deltaproteobacteria bacterium]